MAEEDPTPRPKRTPEQLVEGLVALLDVEELDADLYRGMRYCLVQRPTWRSK